MSDRVAIFPAIIEAVHHVIGGVIQPSVPLFGPASGYCYDVFVNFPDGGRIVPRMVPVEERYEDDVNVIPLQAGRAVMVAVVAGQLQLLASEKLHVVPCGSTP